MKRISLTQGQFAIVDNKNYGWLNQWKWCAWWSKDTKSFYAVRRSTNQEQEDSRGYIIRMHREILGLKYGDKNQSDHINHKTLDNRECNLRIVTHQQNQWNNKKAKGYFWHKTAKKYEAYVKLNGKKIFLGMFNTSKEAHNAYLKAKEKYHKI